MDLIGAPPQNEFMDQRSVTTQDQMPLPFLFAKARPTTSWTTFFSNAYQLLVALTLSGTTANRPIKFLFIGRTYFDTSLTKPVWVSSVNSSGVATWVDATGTPV